MNGISCYTDGWLVFISRRNVSSQGFSPGAHRRMSTMQMQLPTSNTAPRRNPLQQLQVCSRKQPFQVHFWDSPGEEITALPLWQRRHYLNMEVRHISRSAFQQA